MTETDHDLLKGFRSDHCEAAFRVLVERHLPVVWSCARRVTNGDHALAEDIVQQVFADLARKAGAIPATTPLGGWLHRHAFFTATKVIRSEARRRARESHAATTATAMTEPFHSSEQDRAALWAAVAPHVDAAFATLPAEDRAALVLRYFEKRSLRSVAMELGVSEEAARKRVDRALEKLRRRLKSNGVALTTGAALATLLPQAVVAPPAGLAASVSIAAAAAAAGGAAGTAAGIGASMSHAIARLGGAPSVAAVATALVLVVGGWWWVRRAFSAAGPAHSVAVAVPRPPRMPTPVDGSAEVLPPVHATAFLVPDSLVAARLLGSHRELDEQALLQLVAAAAGKGEGMVIETRPLTLASQQKGVSEMVHDYAYATAFDYGPGGAATATAFATRSYGTMLRVNGGARDADGNHQVSFEFEHHLAAPGEVRWSGNLADPEAEHPSVVSQPLIYPVTLNGRITVAPGQTRLGGAVRIPPGVNPKSSGVAQRLLVFVTLDPAPTQ